MRQNISIQDIIVIILSKMPYRVRINNFSTPGLWNMHDTIYRMSHSSDLRKQFVFIHRNVHVICIGKHMVQNVGYFTDRIFKYFFLNEGVYNLRKFHRKYFPISLIGNTSPLVQKMACHKAGIKLTITWISNDSVPPRICTSMHVLTFNALKYLIVNPCSS